MTHGIVYAALAYTLWGLFPLYFKSLHGIASVEVVTHRVVWSLAFVLAVLLVRRQWGWLRQASRQPRLVAAFAASGLLLSGNWFTYIWAVQNNRVIDASLGYFINPLVNVLMGYLVLHERLRRGQWAAVALAAAGVAWLTWQSGTLPWIALVLAATFATYGLLRKVAVLGPLEGLALETLLLFPVAAGLLLWWATQGSNGFMAAPADTQVLLVLAGPITAVPLLLFAAGARRITLATLGLLQYIGPSLQLLLGVWLYHEPFPAATALGYAAIWAALGVYSLEGWLHSRRP
ncbi:EamA family transporter RarD [Aquabacterium sp. A7-Y]|uniref:EamA family transporter RarD n=1 Tax=Aquabacterium sp. A7-Y TaxID=1349605 RepID=UPI00223D11F7|nr:EamA family transporter RarD [Aquabacterium sp. A7-Y]MCW7536575.1 EamA family transporter RarD [Aquabacterium sp. A7-Y]